ncbi:hypothetical protein [Polaromonas sp. CG9_12]|nr:hypothetical protein [Polaromonas sp. CG9_12]
MESDPLKNNPHKTNVNLIFLMPQPPKRTNLKRFLLMVKTLKIS